MLYWFLQSSTYEDKNLLKIIRNVIREIMAGIHLI